MYPVGTYEDFNIKVKENEKAAGTVVFGVLFLDFNQSDTRSYIANYLDEFHKDSGTYINFYVPGYIKAGNQFQVNDHVKVNDMNYYFSFEEYKKIANIFKSEYDEEFSVLPKLIIFELNEDKEISKEKMFSQIFEDEKSAQKKLKQIIKIAKNGGNDIKSMNQGLINGKLKTYFKEDFFDDIDIFPLSIFAKIFNIIKGD